MYLKMMNAERDKPAYLGHGFKSTWTPFVHQEDAKWAFQQNRTTAAAPQKHPSREQKVAHRAALGPFVTNSGKRKRNRLSRNTAPIECPPPAGAMAPRNTTQYLMSNVYDDLKMDAVEQSAPPCESSSHIYCEGLSPSGVSAALDSCFEEILEYQFRDFDELYGFSWKPE